ncbi:MAG: hypothetical protein JXA87_00645 [Thermoleophilia bacterium]|nr:hypothetical protein [Thermoleophilia bacterium]
MRVTAPVARSVFWLLIALLAWELYQGLRAGAAIPAGSWAMPVVDLVFLVLIPASAAFAFTRLFLVLSQSPRGTLNVYTAISSPMAWVFWLGLAIAMVGHGVHLTAHAIHRAMPAMFTEGEFAAKIAFLNDEASVLLLGIGLFLASLAVLIGGQGTGQRLSGLERMVFLPGSLATYGIAIIYLGVGAGQIIFAIVASAILSAVSLWNMPPSEVTRDPIAALIVPGALLAGVALIIWTVVVGGQPTWP